MQAEAFDNEGRLGRRTRAGYEQERARMVDCCKRRFFMRERDYQRHRKSPKKAREEEVTPTEEEAAVEEEAAELEAAFESEGTPDRTETTEAGVDVQRQEGSDLTKKQQRVVDQANNVLTSLKSLIPDIKVIAHQTQLQYEAATGMRGRGTYISDTQGKTIHINLSRANSRTAFHEAFHAIFLEQIKNGDPDAQAKAKVLLNTIAKALPPKSVLKNRIDRFLTQYDQQDISEEALAEVFSYIANGYSGLGPQVKAKIKVAIKNLIESVTRSQARCVLV